MADKMTYDELYDIKRKRPECCIGCVAPLMGHDCRDICIKCEALKKWIEENANEDYPDGESSQFGVGA